MKVKSFFRRLATLFKCCVSEKKKHNTSDDVRLDVKHVVYTTTQIKDIDIENLMSVGGVFTVKQESDDVKIHVESMGLHEDANELCTSNNITEDDHPNNRTLELEEAVFMETRKHDEGVIRYFGKNNEAGRIISKNGKCYTFYKKDIVGSYKYYKSPQKAKFVVDDSQANWAKDIEIVGDIYGQRCYYCLIHGHYTEECIQLDIDSLNFYCPYI